MFPDVKTIDVGDKAVVIRAGSAGLEGAQRTIHLDVSTHAGAEPSLQGHSIGHWEGSVLVVDTMSFSEHVMGTGHRVPSSEDKHLTERFELSEDGSRLSYSFVVEDPECLTKPFTGEVQWACRPDMRLLEEPCDADVAQRYLKD